MKPAETFGFEQAKQQYSLSSFQLKANQFKQDYFKMSAKVRTCMYMYIWNYSIAVHTQIYLYSRSKNRISCSYAMFLEVV